MSTNINPAFPSQEDIEIMANKLFATLPGNSLSNSLEEFPMKEVVERKINIGNDDPFSIERPESSLPDPFFKNGYIHPGADAYGNHDLTNPASILNQYPYQVAPSHTEGHIPQSLTGHGVSPSAIEQGNAVNLQNPSTSFPDPHINSNGYIPQTGGDQILSPLGMSSFIHSLPFASANTFETQLQNYLGDISGDRFEKHPSVGSLIHTGGNDFYFLKGKEEHLKKKESNSISGRSFLENHHGIKGILTQHFDVNRVRNDFPILKEKVNGKPLIWFDNAATTQKPQQVMDRINYFYAHENSNVHRAAHELAARATDAYEAARKKIQVFLNAASINEIVFVRGATEAINLVAKSWGEQFLNAGDEIILSQLEHHANIVPWKQLADKKGLKIKVIPVDDHGQILLGEYNKLLGPKTRLVGITQVSNALGTITPLKEIIEMAHASGAKVLVDGAQSVSHMKVDLQYLNADWFVFSGHKIFGPTGIGVLYGKEELLNEMQPWQGGGNMIQDVTFDKIIYHPAPLRFEAGTGNIADAVGLGAAIDYVNRIGIEVIGQYEEFLLTYATRLLKEVPGIRLIGTAAKKASVVSFVLEGHKTEDIGAALNKEGIAVRSGHHCAQPILRRFCVETSVRPSLAFYNTCGEIDVLVATLHRIQQGKRKF